MVLQHKKEQCKYLQIFRFVLVMLVYKNLHFSYIMCHLYVFNRPGAAGAVLQSPLKYTLIN